MTTGEKAAVGGFGAMAAGCLIALFFPSVQQGTATSGFSGALGLHMWVLAGAGFLFCSAFVVIVFVNIQRRKKGRPPL